MTWTLKRNDANEVIKKQRQTHSLRERIYGCRGEKMGGMDSYGVWDRYVHTAIFKMETITLKNFVIISCMKRVASPGLMHDT